MASLRLLDTNTVSYLSNQRYAGMVEQFHQTSAHAPVCISAVTEAELRFGLAKVRSARLVEALEAILKYLPSLAWDSAVVQHYAPLRADLARRGRMLDALDLMIAAHALSLGAVLVTHDRAFLQVPSLQVEDWMDNPITQG